MAIASPGCIPEFLKADTHYGVISRQKRHDLDDAIVAAVVLSCRRARIPAISETSCVAAPRDALTCIPRVLLQELRIFYDRAGWDERLGSTGSLSRRGCGDEEKSQV